MSEPESLNYAEYSYEQKSEGKIRLKRTLMVSLYVFVALGYFLFCYVTRIIPLFAIAPMLIYILYLCTWRLVKYDCYWEFNSGTLYIGKIRIKRKTRVRVPDVSVVIKEAIDVGAFVRIEDVGAVGKIYDYSESQRSDKRIYVVFEIDNVRCAAIIEGTAKLAKLLASFSKAATKIKGMEFHG